MRTGYKQNEFAGENTISPMMDAIENLSQKTYAGQKELEPGVGLDHIKRNAKQIVAKGIEMGLISPRLQDL